MSHHTMYNLATECTQIRVLVVKLWVAVVLLCEKNSGIDAWGEPLKCQILTLEYHNKTTTIATSMQIEKKSRIVR